MNTALTTFDPQVPAFLQNPTFAALNAKMGAGLSTGAPPRVSFRGSRFRLVSADGEETLVAESGGTTLDVIVLDANEGVSKFYYANKYDPNAEGEDAAPTCFSENGQAPSARAKAPQSRSCASCPLNAWGSKISDASGKKIKACSDVKKLAVIPVSNLTGDAYVLGIPGASLQSWSGLVSSTSKRGVPISSLIIRLGFDASAAFPKLTFAPTSFMTQDQYNLISDLFNNPDLDQLTGKGDAPHAGPFVLEGQAAPAAPTAPQPVAFQVAQPLAAAPMSPPPGMAMPAHTAQAMAQQPAVPAASQQAAPATRRRGRAAAPAAPAPAPAAPPSPVTAPGTSAQMDALLAKVMGG